MMGKQPIKAMAEAEASRVRAFADQDPIRDL